MKVKITNEKLEDCVYIQANTMDEIKKKAGIQISLRGWKQEDCFSEIIIKENTLNIQPSEVTNFNTYDGYDWEENKD